MSRWEETHTLYESADRLNYNINTVDTGERRNALEAMRSLHLSLGYNVGIFHQATVYMDASIHYKSTVQGQAIDVFFLKMLSIVCLQIAVKNWDVEDNCIRLVDVLAFTYPNEPSLDVVKGAYVVLERNVLVWLDYKLCITTAYNFMHYYLGAKFLDFKCSIKAVACICTAIDRFGHEDGLAIEDIEEDLHHFLDHTIGRDIMYIGNNYFDRVHSCRQEILRARSEMINQASNAQQYNSPVHSPNDAPSNITLISLAAPANTDQRLISENEVSLLTSSDYASSNPPSVNHDTHPKYRAGLLVSPPAEDMVAFSEDACGDRGIEKDGGDKRDVAPLSPRPSPEDVGEEDEPVDFTSRPVMEGQFVVKPSFL